jgi:branched-subunit amino acid ABC-type transport system permease component
VILLVATIGLSQLALRHHVAFPDLPIRSKFPLPVSGKLRISGVTLNAAALTIVVVVPLVAIVLGWLLTRTPFGKSVTAAADNPDLARISGISPKRASTIVWTIAGVVATLALMLIAGRLGGVNQVPTLGPATLARGLVVAVIAGMASFPRCLAAGLVVGLVESVVGYNLIDTPGVVEVDPVPCGARGRVRPGPSHQG